MTDEPTWDEGLAPAVRKRARPSTPPPPASPAPSTAPPAELAARIAAVESGLRTIDVRLEAVEHQLRSAIDEVRAAVLTGFQEAASRSLVLAEATDAILAGHAQALDRLEAALSKVPIEAPPVSVDLSGVESGIAELRAAVAPVPDAAAAVAALRDAVGTMADDVASTRPDREELQRRLADLAVAVTRLQATVDTVVESPEPAALRSQIDLVAERLSTLLGGPTLTELMDRLDEIAERGSAEAPKRRRLRSGE